MSLLLLDCADLKSFTIAPVPPASMRKKEVKAKATKFVFLAFSFSNHFTEELKENLLEQCPQGRIEGISTKFETYSYLLASTLIIEARGYCIDTSNR